MASVPVPPVTTPDNNLSSLQVNNVSRINGRVYGNPYFVDLTTDEVLVKGKDSSNGSVLLDIWNYASSTKDYRLGTLLQQNNATYRYAYTVDGGERGNLTVSNTSGYILGETITAVGTSSITIVNNTGGAIVADDVRYVDGNIVGPGTTGNSAFGLSVLIKSCTAAANGEAVTFTFDVNDFTPATFDAFEVGTTVDIISNPYYVQNASNSATVATAYNQNPAGTHVDGSVSANAYRWLQTSGVASVKCSGAAPTIAIGQAVTIAASGVSAGRIDGALQNTGDPLPPVVGKALAVGVIDQFIPVVLKLE